jgi:hypothetical protein
VAAVIRRTRLLALVVTAMLAWPAAAAREQRQTVRPWFTEGEQFGTVERRLPPSGTVLVPAIRSLLRGPTAAERAGGAETQIPAGVRLGSLTVSGRGRAVPPEAPFVYEFASLGTVVRIF